MVMNAKIFDVQMKSPRNNGFSFRDMELQN